MSLTPEEEEMSQLYTEVNTARNVLRKAIFDAGWVYDEDTSLLRLAYAVSSNWEATREEAQERAEELRPLAEAGRRALTLRRDALRLVASGHNRCLGMDAKIAYEIDGAIIDGEVVDTSDDGSPWFELTDAGRERLAELEAMGLDERTNDANINS